MAVTAAAPTCHLRHFLHSRPSSLSLSYSSSISFLKPLTVSSPIALSTRLRQIHVPPLRKTLFPFLFSISTSSSSSLTAVEAEKSAEDDDAMEQYGEETEVAEDELETERGDFEDTQMDSTSSPLERNREEKLKLELPSLTVKERKELVSYAHSLGKKLKTQLVGKSGVTPNVATSFIETLESNELLKIKIHRSCPGELDDVVKQLEEATGSVAVGQIGRTMIIYRPSLTKLKAEEKKKQVRERFHKRVLKSKLAKANKSTEQAPKLFRRGSSWNHINKSKEQAPKFSRRGSSWNARSSRSNTT
ncbi:uncharacterized protein LOC133287060 [Gastrolobium bilobum]|uniref:uncharacterized protein LOC133287060 n=1 Tax=Gastrolobium bilobum TaxID=150636 RepID=UPI002AAF590C|nr:uncharacterized protein LOC133287060 [Gastrolobium bilobum]XP_061340597.1 uncharacterized protein LOC133287060 [Gastrolobium bilobum]